MHTHTWTAANKDKLPIEIQLGCPKKTMGSWVRLAIYWIANNSENSH